MNKKEKETPTIQLLILNPIVSMLTGFGMFWLFQLTTHNIWLSFLAGYYVVSLMAVLFYKYEIEN